MLLDIRFSIWTLGLTTGTFFAALYGMNLKNFIEESDLGFGGISAVCGVGCLVAVSIGIKKLRKVQRVSMWGHLQRPEAGQVFPYWDKNPKKDSPAPVGWSGLGWGRARQAKAEEKARRHEYWIRRRRGYVEQRERVVEEKRKKKNRAREGRQADERAPDDGGGGEPTPESGYC